MIGPPPNIVFSLFLAPVFEWESSEPADAAVRVLPPTVPPPVCDGSEAVAQQDAPPPAPSNKRLVFKGYEWRAGPQYVLFPPAPWANCFDAGSYEAREKALKEEDERRARAAEDSRNYAVQIARLRAAEALEALKQGEPAAPPAEPSE
jgi:hypothetical protein